MGGCFLIPAAEETGQQGATETQEGFDELGRLLFVSTDKRQCFASNQVTTNQKNSQHAICELIRQSPVKTFGDEIGRESCPSPRSEGDDDRPEDDIFQWNSLSFEVRKGFALVQVLKIVA